MPLDPTKIREFREKLRLTQDDCAAAAKMPQPNWARIESGERCNPHLETAERVAAALKRPLKAILA